MERMDNIGERIAEVIEYLGISPHEFATRCGLSSGQIISVNLKNHKPSLNTLEKILNRYPVNASWLMLGKDNMWELDFFEEKFQQIRNKPSSPAQQINTLLEAFEMNQRQFCKRTGVGTCTLSSIKSGIRVEISKSVRDKICKRFPFIKPVWFYL